MIGAINGPAVGIGATMTLPMDMRLASDDGALRLRLHAPRDRPRGGVGLVPAARRRHQPGDGVGARRAASSTRAEALDGGLVRSRPRRPTSCCPPPTRSAHEIADNTSPVSVALTRQMMWRGLGADDPMEAHKVDSPAIAARGASADAVEGVMSFLEKRRRGLPAEGLAATCRTSSRGGRSGASTECPTRPPSASSCAAP